MADQTTAGLSDVTLAAPDDAARQAFLAYLEAGRQTNLASPDPSVRARQAAIDAQYAPAAPATPSTPTTGDPATQSAIAVIAGALEEAGLGSLARTVWAWWKEGRPLEQIMLDIRDTGEYKARFPYMQTLSQKGHAISEGEAIALERQYAQIGRQYGLPSTFYDQPSDFAKLIGGEVSPAEFSARLQLFEQTVFDTDPMVRNELRRLYGVNEGDLTAFFIDPDRALPLLTRKVRSAEVAAQSQRSGFGVLSNLEAERLSFLDRADAAQGFASLVGLREVLGQLPGEATAGVSRESALDAVFNGDEVAREGIERRAATRRSPFQGGGGFATSQQGLAGVG